MTEKCTDKFLQMVADVKSQKWAYPEFKPFFIAQCILECGRGATDLFALHDNAFGMHYQPFLGTLATGVKYDACDGPAVYAKFYNFSDMVSAYFLWFDSWPHYGDWRTPMKQGGLAFLKHIGPFYCPPGFTKEWMDSHGGLDYADYIVQNLLPEAQALLGPQEKPMSANWINICEKGGCVQAMNDASVIETLEGNSVSALRNFLAKHATAGTWLPGPRKESSPTPTGKKTTRIFLDPGHSNSRPGARSGNGAVREEILNQHACAAMKVEFEKNGYVADMWDPDPDDLVAVGTRARNYDVAISCHHNSYEGSANPYHCIMADPAMPSAQKLITSRIAIAIGNGAKGTIAETKVFEGTNGILGVYECELTVLNTSRNCDKPPFHILPELYFLNMFTNENACIVVSEKIAVALAQQVMKEFPN
jgi:N-acetylmuramoyl-L-alanine amidase